MFRKKLLWKSFFWTKNDIKNTWKLIKSGIQENNQKHDSIHELSINGQTVSDKSIMANKFNEYFANIGNDLAKKIPKLSESYSDYINHIQPINSFFSKPTDSVEIIDIVQNLKSGQSYLFPKS